MKRLILGFISMLFITVTYAQGDFKYVTDRYVDKEGVSIEYVVEMAGIVETIINNKDSDGNPVVRHVLDIFKLNMARGTFILSSHSSVNEFYIENDYPMLLLTKEDLRKGIEVSDDSSTYILKFSDYSFSLVGKRLKRIYTEEIGYE